MGFENELISFKFSKQFKQNIKLLVIKNKIVKNHVGYIKITSSSKCFKFLTDIYVLNSNHPVYSNMALHLTYICFKNKFLISVR